METNYEYSELIRFNAINIAALVTWIDGIVTRVKANPTAVINCASQANSTSCLQTRAREFVTRAFRSDATTAQLDRFVQFFVTSVSSVGVNEATGDLVDVVLSSPQFLFRMETSTGTNYRLTNTQLLQNIAYTLADSPPEGVGFQSSSASSLASTPDQVRSTVQSLAVSTAAREKLVLFFKRWLEIKDPTAFDMKAVDFPEFTPAVAQEVVNETDRFLRHHLNKVAPKLKEVTQSQESFVSRSIASIYDMNGSNLTGTTAVPMDTSKRLGIFTQSAVIASHSGAASTRPIKRGVFWVNKLLCLGVEPPPSSLDTSVPDTSAAVTERQRLEIATNQSACIGCH